MKALTLVKTGPPESAFEMRETRTPTPGAEQVLIKVDGFGINFADVMARLGLYRDAPDLPAILGYDVVGRITAVGAGVDESLTGARVAAFTLFGGYAEYVVTDMRAMVQISEQMEAGVAVALATQYCTAYYLAEEMAPLQAGDRVLIHAAAGGVGTALVQLARHKGAVIFGTAGSDNKLEYLRETGVHHPINYRKNDFFTEVQKVLGSKGLDVIFDPVGGKSVKKGYRLLGPGGRLVAFGASSMTQTNNIFGKIKLIFGFGFYHPVGLLTKSRGIIGVNMRKVADHRIEKLQRVFKQVVSMNEQGILAPKVGGTFPVSELAEAHRYMESRQSMGKIVVMWK
jgi:NADPH2:quinone reductase